jgi:hypothetical protein
MDETLPLADSAKMPALSITDVGPSASRKAFNAALALAQGDFLPITKNRDVRIVMKTGGEYRFKYADLQEIHAKTRPALSANGLSTTAQMIPGDDGVSLMLALAHADGFERVSEVFVTYGDDIKQFGGKLSFMRRYMLQNLLDVAADDDLDENGQEGDGGAPAARAPAPPRTPARKPAAAPAKVSNNEPPPDDGPPPDEAELQQRAQTRVAGAADARERVTAAAPAIDEAKVAQQTESINAQIAARTPAVAPAPADDGELCEVGEINFLLKRCKTRGGDMGAVLAELGLDLDPATLAGLTKTMWSAIKSKV